MIKQTENAHMLPDDFKNIRREANLSLRDLSEIIKVHDRTIRRYENGIVPISGPVSVLMELISEGRL